jgi:hypothetical protein
MCSVSRGELETEKEKVSGKHKWPVPRTPACRKLSRLYYVATLKKVVGRKEREEMLISNIARDVP